MISTLSLAFQNANAEIELSGGSSGWKSSWAFFKRRELGRGRYVYVRGTNARAIRQSKDTSIFQPKLSKFIFQSTHVHTSMALNICNSRTEELAATVAEMTGETETEAVTKALQERLTKLQRQRKGRRLAGELKEIAMHCAALPVFDERTADEIIGYDERGLPA